MTEMQWILLLSLVAILGLTAVTFARRIGSMPLEEIGEDGAVQNNTDNDAPKVIVSTQIISFDCRFSTMDIAESGSLGNHVYQLQAKLENGAVKGEYQVWDTGEKRVFRESHFFLRKVQNLVGAYDFAQYNGHSYTVAGLPNDYGVRLEIVYASGERIYAYNNQDNFLPLSAMNELVKLFERGVSVT